MVKAIQNIFFIIHLYRIERMQPLFRIELRNLKRKGEIDRERKRERERERERDGGGHTDRQKKSDTERSGRGRSRRIKNMFECLIFFEKSIRFGKTERGVGIER